MQKVVGNGGSGAGGKKLTRGFIIQKDAVSGVRYRCNFLYNPSVLNVSHSVDSDVLADENSKNPNDVTKDTYLMPLQQSLNFSLLFDRTYEMWDSSKLYGDALLWVPQFGVAYDVLSLYKITGVAAPVVIEGDGTDATASSEKAWQKGNFSTGPAGPMLSNPVFVVIGSTLSYYGIIQSLNVQYTHWTQSMIPTRCQVDITVTLLPTPTGGNKYAPIIGPRVANWGDPLSTSEQLGKNGVAGR
ncbi:hypothetical protein [Streptomyces sp. NPDC002088]|uniref:hypothetical protein n=1 Tax=Streptomyces sp. NPDC002088 TaxID=3154665 RepID=UPI0033190F20